MSDAVIYQAHLDRTFEQCGTSYSGHIIFSTGCRFIEVVALKSGVGEINLFFSELLDWIAFIFLVSGLDRVGIKAIERFFRSSNLNPGYESETKMQPKKPHFVQ